MTRLRTIQLLLAVLLALATTSSGFAQSSLSYAINWYSVNSGGGLLSSTSLRLNGTAGQSLAGYAESTSYKHWVGFWAVESASVQPTHVDRIKQAKLLPDGTLISIDGKVATCDGTDFSGFFYAEEPDRSSGIRIVTSGPVAGLVEGMTITTVVGTMQTTSDDERYIQAVTVTTGSVGTKLAPLGMINRTAGGANAGVPPNGQYGVDGGTGSNTVGLLVRIWGAVTGTGSGYVLINDGSGVPVRVEDSKLGIVIPGQYIAVTGSCSLQKDGAGHLRYILPRKTSDVATF